jgi:hypothetical protein
MRYREVGVEGEGQSKGLNIGGYIWETEHRIYNSVNYAQNESLNCIVVML